MKITKEVRTLADKAAEKKRSGYEYNHALNSALKEKRKELPAEAFEKLRGDVAAELRRRSAATRTKRARIRREQKKEELAEIRSVEEERQAREARRMSFQRRDHLLTDP